MNKFLKAALLAVLPLSVAACGSPADDYIGTWNGAGTIGLTASNGGSEVLPQAQTVVISEGVSSDIVVQNGECQLPFDIDGDSAVIAAGYECVTLSGALRLRYAQGSLIKTSSAATLSGSGSFTLNDSNSGATITGTFTQAGTLTKITN